MNVETGKSNTQDKTGDPAKKSGAGLAENENESAPSEKPESEKARTTAVKAKAKQPRQTLPSEKVAEANAAEGKNSNEKVPESPPEAQPPAPQEQVIPKKEERGAVGDGLAATVSAALSRKNTMPSQADAQPSPPREEGSPADAQEEARLDSEVRARKDAHARYMRFSRSLKSGLVKKLSSQNIPTFWAYTRKRNLTQECLKFLGLRNVLSVHSARQ